MARVEIPLVVQSTDVNGKVVFVSGASALVSIRGGGTATVYQAETGGTTLSNPLTTDANGRVEGWVDRGAYDVYVTGGGLQAYTHRFEAAPGSPGSIDSAWFSDGTITSAKISDNAVIASKIPDSSIAAGKLVDSTITTAKIGASQITTALLNDLAVTTGKLNGSAVTTEKIADGAITGPKMSGPFDVNVITVTYGAGQTLKYAQIHATTNGDNTIISAVSGKVFRVISYVLVASAAITVRWYTGASAEAAPVSGGMPFAANGGVAIAGSVECPLFTTATNNKALVLNTNAAGTVAGHIAYFEA